MIPCFHSTKQFLTLRGGHKSEDKGLPDGHAEAEKENLDGFCKVVLCALERRLGR